MYIKELIHQFLHLFNNRTYIYIHILNILLGRSFIDPCRPPYGNLTWYYCVGKYFLLHLCHMTNYQVPGHTWGSVYKEERNAALLVFVTSSNLFEKEKELTIFCECWIAEHKFGLFGTKNRDRSDDKLVELDSRSRSRTTTYFGHSYS